MPGPEEYTRHPSAVGTCPVRSPSKPAAAAYRSGKVASEDEV